MINTLILRIYVTIPGAKWLGLDHEEVTLSRKYEFVTETSQKALVSNIPIKLRQIGMLVTSREFNHDLGIFESYTEDDEIFSSNVDTYLENRDKLVKKWEQRGFVKC